MSKVILFLVVGVLAIGCSKSEPPTSEPPKSESPHVPKVENGPAAARALIASGATVIDVRTADEFAEGHVATAVNVPVEDLPTHLAEVNKLVGGDRSRPVVVYCASGGRAATAKTDLEAAGYSHVVNGGGYSGLH